MTDTTEQEFNFDAFIYGVRCDSPFDGSTLADSISDDEVRRAESAFNSLLKRAEKAEKSNAFLKEQLAQLANFNPDWDMLEACRESWREVVALLKEREAELAALKGDQVPVALVDIQHGRSDGNLFAVTLTKAGHALKDDVYELFTAPQKPVVCQWSADEDFVYSTSCDNEWQFTEGGIEENEIIFCPYCAGKISAAPKSK